MAPVPHLDRFVNAQERAYPTALAEVRRGRKASHWMWFVFPQLAGLGHSDMARRYAIGSLEEAAAYLAHPVLGSRLRAITQAAIESGAASAHALFGSPDDLKFRSCLTLFARADPDAAVFRCALDRFFGGLGDVRTEALLDGRA